MIDPHAYFVLARRTRRAAATVLVLAVVFIAGLLIGHWA